MGHSLLQGGGILAHHKGMIGIEYDLQVLTSHPAHYLQSGSGGGHPVTLQGTHRLQKDCDPVGGTGIAEDGQGLTPLFHSQLFIKTIGNGAGLGRAHTNILRSQSCRPGSQTVNIGFYLLRIVVGSAEDQFRRTEAVESPAGQRAAAQPLYHGSQFPVGPGSYLRPRQNDPLIPCALHRVQHPKGGATAVNHNAAPF